MTDAPAPAPRPARPLVRSAGVLVMAALDAALLAAALGGVRGLLAHPRALTLLALFTLSGALLTWRAPARAQDTVMVRRDPAWRLLLLALVPLVIPALSALGERTRVLLLPGGALLGWCGVALAAAGLGLRVAAMLRLGPRFAPVPAVQRTHALEQDGVYAHVRHPGYLGAWLTALGAMLAFTSGLAMPLLVLFSALLAARARDEDRLLEEQLGGPWRAYAQRTGAFLPRLGR